MRRVGGCAKPFALAVIACVFSAPAVACMCSCSWFSSPEEEEIAAVEATPAQFDQVFSGVVLSTERIRKPLHPADVGKEFVVSPGYWIRSRILVLRVWQGTPPTVAEVWTSVVTNCDVAPVTGFYFVALVRSEEGRSVADNTLCDCVTKAAVTKGRGTFAVAGTSITAAAIGAAVVAFFALVKLIRRRRRTL